MFSDRLHRMLTAYVDGELTGKQHKAVLDLLRQSPEARVFLRSLQADASLIRELPRRSPELDLSGRVLERITATTTPPAPRPLPARRSLRPAWLGLAAAALVLLVAGISAYYYFASGGASQPVFPQLAQGTAGDDQASAAAPEQGALPEPQKLPENRQRDAGKETPPRVPKDDHAKLPPVAVVEANRTAPDASQQKAASAPPAENRLGTPVKKLDQFVKPELNVPLILQLSQLGQEKREKELRSELGKPVTAHSLDLPCQDPAVALVRLKAALEEQGIQLLIDQDAQDRLQLRLKTNFALYIEDASPEEVLTFLRQLGSADRKAEARRRGTGQFSALTVTALNHEQLAKSLGVATFPVEKAPAPKASGVGTRRPISADTEEKVMDSLKGQGRPRTQVGKPALDLSGRIAVVTAFNSSARSRPPSPELRLFLENRKDQRPGTTRLFLLLRGIKN